MYEYAHSRLKISAQQTPLFWALQQEGMAVEIGNYRGKHERERREALRQLMASARDKFDALQAIGVLTHGQVDSILRLLERDEASLFPHDRVFRNNFIRYLKGEVDFANVFAGVLQIDEHPPPSEPEPLELVGAVAPPALSPPIPPEPSILDPPVTPSTPEVLPRTSGGDGSREGKKSILSLSPTKVLFIPAVFAIGVVILGVYFFFAPGTTSVPVEPKSVERSLRA